MPSAGHHLSTGRRICVLAVVMVASLLDASPARAHSLADSLHLFIDDNASIFAGGVTDILTPLVTRLAERGTALPATSTLPGVTYRFVETGTFEREAGPLGSVFLERTETIGRGRWTLGVDYLFADLTQFDGHDLAEQLDYASDLRFGDVRVQTRLHFRDFSLQVHQLAASATYGLGERWDVNLLVPLVYTKLDVKADRIGHVEGEKPVRDTVRLSDDASGIGDVLVRTKYRLPIGAPIEAAAALELYAPSGTEGDFHGLGDWRVLPLLIASRAFGRHAAHLNAGIEIDADDLERTRARYGLGISLQPTERLSVPVDLIGSSSLVADHFEVTSAGNFASSRFLDRFQTRPPIVEAGGVRAFLAVPRSDIVDVAVGVKALVADRWTAFVQVLVPIVDDGLRAEAVPAAGLEFTF